ncbi:MAG: Lrp/AsnC family transcriptional regulator [Sphingomonadales bacterium]|nr:MAG: Lrp/AsnC family transcriptional regulator [Sphingomonadales bacterium]
MAELDEFDRNILALLQEDARMPVATIADRIALSATPCSRRIKRLEETGVIEGYGARLNARALGFGLEAFVEVNLEAHTDANTARFHETISAMPNVMACHAVTGDMDYLLHILAEDVDHLSQVVLKTLVRIPGVRDVKSMLVLETVKKSHRTPIRDQG